MYDRVVEIDLSTLEPLVNGPYTPDLANPISQLGKNAQENGWPLDIKVGQFQVNMYLDCVSTKYSGKLNFVAIRVKVCIGLQAYTIVLSVKL